jgi:microsomal epoxide hydrolase
MSIEPFRIQVADAVLDDLRARLERARWPDEIPG